MGLAARTVLVQYDDAHCDEYQDYSDYGFGTEMFVKEEHAEQYCSKRLKCTEDGCKCRADASYSFHSGEIGNHRGP